MPGANPAARGSSYALAILMLVLTAATAATAQAPFSSDEFSAAFVGAMTLQ